MLARVIERIHKTHLNHEGCFKPEVLESSNPHTQR